MTLKFKVQDSVACVRYHGTTQHGLLSQRCDAVPAPAWSRDSGDDVMVMPIQSVPEAIKQLADYVLAHESRDCTACPASRNIYFRQLSVLLTPCVIILYLQIKVGMMLKYVYFVYTYLCM